MSLIASRPGEIFAVLSVFAFSFGGVSIAKARRNGGDGGAILSVVFTALLSALLWISTGASTSVWASSHSAVTGLGWFALSGILATALARSFYFMSVRDLGAIRGAAVKRAIPFFSVLFGVLLLGEILTGSKVAALGLIAASVAALVGLDLAVSRNGGRHDADAIAPIGYVWGVVSGLCYASAYVARKLGLNLVPDGALGTFVGAMAAVGYYGILAVASSRGRASIADALRIGNTWAVVAALCFSAGQIANFYAIQHTAISTVGAIQSLEVFVSMLFAAFILRTERAPGPATIAAAVVATIGVLLMIA